MTADLKPYADCKHSGSPWLGAVPAHWEVSHLSAVAQRKSITDQSNRELLSVYLQRGVIRFSDVLERRTNPTSEDLSQYQAVDPGDFVLNNQQAWRGSVGVSRYAGIVSPAYLVLALSPSYLSRYANLLFRDRTMVSQYRVCSKGVGSIQRNLYWPQLKRVAVPIPPADEQNGIIRFLDSFSAGLGQTVQTKRRIIALLNEHKQAVVSKAVTRGLDPSVPLVSSGVSWLGEIPEHWRVTRIKYLLREVDQRSNSGEERLLSMRMHHGIVPFADHFERPPQAASLAGFKVVHPGQVVVNRMQAGNGLIFVSQHFGLVSPDYAVFEPIGDVDVEFLGELFRSRLLRAKFRAESKGLGTGTSGFLRLYDDRLGAIHVALPSVPEQKLIIEQLREELSGANRAISTREREIELIQEYRVRLTTDVVTGKLDVRAAATSLQDLVDSNTDDGDPALDRDSSEELALA